MISFIFPETASSASFLLLINALLIFNCIHVIYIIVRRNSTYLYPPIYQETSQFEGNYYTIPTGGPVSLVDDSSTEQIDSAEKEMVRALFDDKIGKPYLKTANLSF